MQEQTALFPGVSYLGGFHCVVSGRNCKQRVAVKAGRCWWTSLKSNVHRYTQNPPFGYRLYGALDTGCSWLFTAASNGAFLGRRRFKRYSFGETTFTLYLFLSSPASGPESSFRLTVRSSPITTSSGTRHEAVQIPPQANPELLEASTCPFTLSKSTYAWVASWSVEDTVQAFILRPSAVKTTGLTGRV